jgi:Protein of unknown function (DUF2946)
MWRRLELLIPIVMLALVVQLLAPIAAFRVVAYASTDPLYMASICEHVAPSADVQSGSDRSQHEHGSCCAFCGLGVGGTIALGSPPPIFVTLQRQYQRLSWLETAETMSAVRVGSNAQARAPPSFS